MIIWHRPILFGWFWKERHCKGCTCTYCCGETKLHYGLNMPKDWKAWNSWYVIKYWPHRYVRWTNSWLKRGFIKPPMKKKRKAKRIA